MTDLTKLIVGAALGLGIWIIKLITNANDPDRQVKKNLLRLLNTKTKLVRKKIALEKEIKECDDKDKRLRLGDKLSGINVELAGLRQEIEKFAFWRE